jgi:hypothetical protein
MAYMSLEGNTSPVWLCRGDVMILENPDVKTTQGGEHSVEKFSENSIRR